MWGIVHLFWLRQASTCYMAGPPAEPVPTLTGLAVGDIVHVKDVDGRSVKGAIAEASGTLLTIDDEERSIIVLADEVQTVERQDSVLNGVLLELTAGMAGTAAMSRTGVCGEGAECFGYLLLAGLGGGAAIGAGIDTLMHATLYRRPDAARVRVSPLVSQDRIGARCR